MIDLLPPVRTLPDSAISTVSTITDWSSSTIVIGSSLENVATSAQAIESLPATFESKASLPSESARTLPVSLSPLVNWTSSAFAIVPSVARQTHAIRSFEIQDRSPLIERAV